MLYSYDVDEGEYVTRDGSTFFAYTGGIWNENVMNGTIVGIYLRPGSHAGLFDDEEFAGSYYPFYDDGEGLWQVTATMDAFPMATSSSLGDFDPYDLESYIEMGELDGDLYGTFGGAMDYFDMEEEGQEGDPFIEGISIDMSRTTFIHDTENEISQRWGIYDLKLIGPESYYNPDGSSVWFGDIEGEGDFGYSDYGNTGSWIGGIGGVATDGEIEGFLGGLYITENNRTGFIGGDVYGLYDPSGEAVDSGTWIAESIGIFHEMGDTEYSPEEIGEITEDSGLAGTGVGGFSGGAAFEDIVFEGFDFSIPDEDWGIWYADFKGVVDSSAPTTSSWGATIRATTGATEGEGDDTIILATIEGGAWTPTRISGDEVYGYFWTPPYEGEGGGEEGTLLAGVISGDVIGTYEVEGEETSFDAICMGEWRDLAELQTDILGFDFDDLNNFITVPVTEVYQNDLAGIGAFGAGGGMNGSMDMSFYADAQDFSSGLWAAYINGSYTTPTSDDFILQLQSDTLSATLTGVEWADNEWHAGVEGIGPDGLEFNGDAGGTYSDINPDTNSGNFEGMGAGTYEINE